MNLIQIEKEAEKVKTNEEHIKKNKKRLFWNGLRDFVTITFLIIISCLMYLNVKRIDKNTRILVEKTGVNYSIQTNSFYGKEIPYLGVFSEKLILKD